MTDTVLMHCKALCRRLVDAVAAHQCAGMARVLTGDGVGQVEYVQRAQADIGQVADRRGHDIQGALRIMLRSAGVVRGA